MNARFLILGLSAAGALALAACESNNTVIYDPATTKTGLRATKTRRRRRKEARRQKAGTAFS